jgi:hypothetical protein
MARSSASPRLDAPRRFAVRAVALGLVILLAAAIPGASLAKGKPGYPDRVTWSGGSWQVKTSNAAVGPGPNIFAKANVNVDASGFLHLRIAKDASNRWTTAEVIGPTSHGYGTYSFVVATPLDALDRNVVLGLFTWSDRPQQAHREIDFEAARWGSATDPTNGQFVVQPYDKPDHLARFTLSSAVQTLQQFTWRAGEVTFLSRRLDTGATVASYTYRGADVPKPGDERVRLNLWLFEGAGPSDGQPVEVVVESFTFVP